MDALDAIFTRKSTRQYADLKINDEALHTILLAGMSGPSCANTRDWVFLVIRDRETLRRMAEGNGPPAQHLLGADVGILICGDLEQAFPPAKEYWIIDGAIAGQNMTLAAQALGIGCVWLGTWPEMDRVENQTRLFSLPETIIPHSILAFGYPAGGQPGPADSLPHCAEAKWEADRVHWEAYGQH